MDGTGKLQLLLLSLRPPAVLLQQRRQGKRTNQSHAGTLLSVRPCNEPTPASFVVSFFFLNKKKRLKVCTNPTLVMPLRSLISHFQTMVRQEQSQDKIKIR